MDDANSQVFLKAQQTNKICNNLSLLVLSFSLSLSVSALWERESQKSTALLQFLSNWSITVQKNTRIKKKLKTKYIKTLKTVRCKIFHTPKFFFSLSHKLVCRCDGYSTYEPSLIGDYKCVAVSYANTCSTCLHTVYIHIIINAQCGI